MGKLPPRIPQAHAQIKAEVSRTKIRCLFCMRNLSVRKKTRYVGQKYVVHRINTDSEYFLPCLSHSKASVYLLEILFKWSVCYLALLSLVIKMNCCTLKSSSESEFFSYARWHVVGSALFWGHGFLLGYVRSRDLWSGSEFKWPDLQILFRYCGLLLKEVLPSKYSSLGSH